MHILKRLLLLCFMGAGVEAARSQPAASDQANPNPAAPKAQADEKAGKPAANSAVVAVSGGAAMNPDAERQARDLLRTLTTGPAPSEPKVSKKAARTQANSPEAAASKAALDAERDREIARIEAEVEAARKRRESQAAAAGSSAVSVPA